MKASQYDLSKAMGQMRTSEKKTGTFMEVLGSDVDSSFKQPIQYFVSSSVAELSICGQSVTSGNMQINIRDDNILLDVHRTAVQFKITLPDNAIVENWLQLFQPINATVGQFQWSVSDGAYLVQQKLYTTPKDQLRYCARGLGLPLTEYQENIGATGTQLYFATDTSVAASNPLANQAFYKWGELGYSAVAANTYIVSIPIAKLFPFVEETFTDGYVYLGLGQSFVGSCQINSQYQYLLGKPGANLGLQVPTITNAQLFKVYVELDSERTSDILRSTIPLRKHDFLLVKQQLQQSVVLNYNLNEKQRAEKIYIAAHWGKQALTTSQAANNSIAGNAYDRTYQEDLAGAGTQSAYKAPLNYMSNVWQCLSLVQLNFGGHVRTINAQLLHSLLSSEDHVFQSEFYYDSQISRQIKSVLVLDLKRFGFDDLIGSSSGNQQSIQLQLVFDTSENGGFIYPGIAANTFSTGFNLFQVESFLQTSTAAEIQNGIYKLT